MGKIRFIKLALPVFLVTLLAVGSCGASIPTPTGFIPSITPTGTIPSTDIHNLPFDEGDLSNWEISEAEAIATASQHVPAEVVSHAKILAGQGASGNINTGEQHLYWEVIFMNISITKDWLGWQSGNQTILDSEGPYNEIVVRIDALTGEFMDRRAYFAVSLGGPTSTPGTTMTPVTPVTSWTPSSATAVPPAQ